MRSEAEIKEAMALMIDTTNADLSNNMLLINSRDSTIEAFRFCLGIDDAETSPMEHSLAELIQDLKDGDPDRSVSE